MFTAAALLAVILATPQTTPTQAISAPAAVGRKLAV